MRRQPGAALALAPGFYENPLPVKSLPDRIRHLSYRLAVCEPPPAWLPWGSPAGRWVRGALPSRARSLREVFAPAAIALPRNRSQAEGGAGKRPSVPGRGDTIVFQMPGFLAEVLARLAA